MRYVYVLATDDKDKEIAFESAIVEADDDDTAYLAGQRYAKGQGWLPVSRGRWGNDYVVPIPEPEIVWPEPHASLVK